MWRNNRSTYKSWFTDDWKLQYKNINAISANRIHRARKLNRNTRTFSGKIVETCTNRMFCRIQSYKPYTYIHSLSILYDVFIRLSDKTVVYLHENDYVHAGQEGPLDLCDLQEERDQVTTVFSRCK